jgi:hypothetical protein
MALLVRERGMGPSRITVIFVVAVPEGWEARHRGQVLYWGPSLDRTVREARRLADLYDDAHVVVQGQPSVRAPRKRDEARTRADSAR